MEQEFTPKETADELFLKFRKLVKHPESPFTKYVDDIAKQNTLFAIDDDKATKCALLLVNKVIKVLEEVCDDRGYDPFEAPLGNLKYYKEVKQELLKDEISKVNKESDECLSFISFTKTTSPSIELQNDCIKCDYCSKIVKKYMAIDTWMITEDNKNVCYGCQIKNNIGWG